MKTSSDPAKIFAQARGVDLRRVLQISQQCGYSMTQPMDGPNGEKRITLHYDAQLNPDSLRHIWTYTDTWYGGEPYSGITTIALCDKVCWTMVYFGRIMPIPNLPQEPVLNCLSEALKLPHPEHPWRGPAKLTANNGLRYRNQWKGSIRHFEGKEVILSKNSKNKLYEATYMGGIVDQY